MLGAIRLDSGGRLFRALVMAAFVAASAPPLLAQQELTPEEAALVDRPIVRVDIEGLSRVSEQKVRNTIRTQAGSPYDPRTIDLDLHNLNRLGDFRTITPLVTLQPDGTVVVTFDLQEQPLLVDVQVVGNRVIDDQSILDAILLRSNVPRDDYLIDESITRIRSIYRDRGHFRVEVEVDEELLEKSDLLIFRIIEGPRVRVRAIEFRGNKSFSRKQLKAQIKSETAFFLFRKGRLNDQVIERDIRALDSFYKDRGYLEVRVGRDLELSPDDREAKIIFLIEEGPIFTMRDVTSNGSTVYSDEALAALLEIKAGDVYSRDKIRKSIQVVKDAYGEQGYYDISVDAVQIHVGDENRVDLLLTIREGPHEKTADNRYRVGDVSIQGNFLTKDKVIRRNLPFAPGRTLTASDIAEAERRLRVTTLFSDVRITVQDSDPENPRYRDVLVEIEERNTGSLNFGVAVGSDAGLFGNISVNQRNFDIADYPESFDEWIKQRSLRGAGQQFSMALQPGAEISRYSISLTEPWFLETPYSLTGSSFFRDRRFSEYDEERFNGTLRILRRFGQLWMMSLATTIERVELSDIDFSAPTEIFDNAGPDTLTSLGLRLTRTTVGTRIRPGRGSVLELGLDQYGVFGGDFSFTRANAEYTLFLTLNEDFLGRKSILRLNGRVAYIFQRNEAPTYEQFYLGGRSLRGLDFRTVSPKGVRADNGQPSDEPVGGEWLVFLGAQYEFPLFGDFVNGVFFVDSGTVTDDPGLDDFRVTFGLGLRLYIDAFGPVPIALDFGFPFAKQEDDDTQLFSFAAEIPF